MRDQLPEKLTKEVPLDSMLTHFEPLSKYKLAERAPNIQYKDGKTKKY